MAEVPFLKLDDIGKKNAEAASDDFPSGLWHDYAERLTTLTVTTATPVSYFTLTTAVIPAGDYLINWSGLWSTSPQNGNIIIDVEVDGVNIWSSEENGARAGRKTFAGKTLATLADNGDTHTVEIFVSQTGPGNASLLQGCISLERWE